MQLSDYIIQMKAYVAQACKASLENRHITINLNQAQVELADAEKELMWLRSTYDASQKEYEQNQKRIGNLRSELERERCFCLFQLI